MFESSSVPPRFKARFPLKVPSFSFQGGRIAGTLFKLFLLILPLILLRGCFITYVAPDQIGVRQVALGPNKGLQKKVIASGYRRQIRGYETVRTFPRDLQIIDFTNNAAERSRDHRTVSAINVPTVDGYPVAVDVTVMYRINDPFLVVSKSGFGRAYEDNVVIRFTDPIVKQFLGELRAEEFYLDQRLAKARDLKIALAERLHAHGLQLLDIVIRQYDYPDVFQALTEQKKLQDQSVLTNRALAKQAEVDTRLKMTAQQGQNAINFRTVEFQAQITNLNAQRELYERSRHAEADLLVRKAEAQGTELMNRAMEGAGSDKLLKLRKGLALLNSIKGPIYITEDPTDLRRLSSNH
ncbi:MAG TPA: SPFH domain-containing protein [Thermoanaerobaculia bacterium]|nr:SPFH domain-containing protein [Thermoanaerobaculia bacterium]